MIAICDLYADGRDMSWLWDVDFTSLRPTGVAMVSGTRAWDMALRLEYDQVRVEQTGTDLEAAVRQFVTARTHLLHVHVDAPRACRTRQADHRRRCRRRAMNGATTDSMSGKGERIWEK